MCHFKCLICIPCDKTFYLVPWSGSSALVKVKYQGHIFHKMDISEALVFLHIMFFYILCCSLFRLTKDGEAFSLYKNFDVVLTVLGRSTSSLYTEEKTQAVCDAVREHPTWNCAHVAAYTGLFEAFRIKEVVE